MRKLLILALFFIPVILEAQNTRYDLRMDTVTYRYYLKGDWKKLIDTTKQAIQEKIDFKYLRQRLGYAYFVTGNYYASQAQYEKAFAFDKTDPDTRTYLYYCGLYTGNEVNKRYWSGLLSNEMKKSYTIKPFKIINSIDFEYNYKSNDNSTRGNPVYMRGGVSTELGYRLNLYQSFSTYSQTNGSSYVNTTGTVPVQTKDSSIINQNEYFALLSWTISPHLILNAGYHTLNSKIHIINKYSYRINAKQFNILNDTTENSPGNMFCSKLTYTVNRFDVGVSGSVYMNDTIVSQQYGVHAGVLLPGSLNAYLKSSLYAMLDTKNNNRLIFTQSAGALFFKKLWVEGDITFGNLNNYSDNNGMYIYNSIDPTTFRTGLTLFWNVIPKLSVYGNYTYDTKLIEDKNISYNQHSFSGGIIWKL